MRVLLRVLAMVAVGGGLLGDASAQARAKKAPARAKTAATAECQADTECVLVADGCCGCSEGGKQRAVPRKGRDAYEKKRKAVCRETMCPQLMSEDPSCT